MNPKQSVSVNQMGFLINVVGYGGIIFLHPEITAQSGRMAWITEFVSAPVIIALALWVLFLAKFYPGKTVFEMLETFTGKVSSMILGILFLGILIITHALFLVQFTAMIKTYFLPLSPVYFPLCLTLIFAAIIASKGLEPLAPTNLKLGVILLIVFFSVMGLGFVHLFSWSDIFPVFDKDFPSFLNGLHLSTGLLCDSVLLWMILVAYLPAPAQQFKKIAVWFLLLVFIVSMAIFFLMGIIPEEFPRTLFVGIYVAQAISFGRFLEVFVLLAYAVIAVFRLALCIYCGQVFCSQIFGTKFHRMIQASITVTIFFLSLIVGSINKANFYYVLMAKFVIPPFILTVLTLTTLGLWSKRRKERKNINISLNAKK